MEEHSPPQDKSPPALKRPRRSDYEEMKDLTETYIRKVRRTLDSERCTDAGALQSSLQKYFASEQFCKDTSEGSVNMSVLAFIMHAAEVAAAGQKPLKPPESMVRTETIVTKPIVSGPPVLLLQAQENARKVEVSAEVKPVQSEMPGPANVETPAGNKETDPAPKPKPEHQKIFHTEVGRKTPKETGGGKGKCGGKGTKSGPQAKVDTPLESQSDYFPMPAEPQVPCQLCGQMFWSCAEMETHHFQTHVPVSNEPQSYYTGNLIQCPWGECDEQFDDNNDLLVHMRTAHNS